jgi:hypothetical protein
VQFLQIYRDSSEAGAKNLRTLRPIVFFDVHHRTESRAIKPTPTKRETTKMKSLSNLTSAKVRRFFLIAAVVVCPFLAVRSGQAQATVNASLFGPNGSSTVNIMQGQSFTLTLQITTNFISSGITYFLQSNNGNGFFRIIARDVTSFRILAARPAPDPAPARPIPT